VNKVINVKLTSSGIEAAIRELRKYERRLYRKSVVLRERVSYFISKDASAVFNTAVAGDDLREGTIAGNVQVSVEQKGNNVTLIIADGKDAVFMEFGAGVYFNGPVGSSPNPLGTELGFTIGSYSTHKPDKEIWGYKGEDGEIHLTHGTPASMPLYRAVQRVWKDIDRIAQEVFST
jgi:hypothetical protein